MRKYIQKVLVLLAKISLVSLFKIIGPPRILQFGWPVNAAILRAFGAKVSKNGVYVHSPVILHGGRQGYANLTISEGCLINGNNFLDLSGGIALIPALVGPFGVAEVMTVMRDRAAVMAIVVIGSSALTWAAHVGLRPMFFR